MIKYLSKVTPLAATALLVLTGVAWAGANDDFGCSNATLKGLYAFGGTNYTLIRVNNGIKFFDGNGNLKQRDYRGNSSPPDFAPPGQETGTYQVNSDCTGSMQILLNTPGFPSAQGGVINVLFVISDGGRHIHEVVSQQTPPGSTVPVPVQTSVDDWKVASEQKN